MRSGIRGVRRLERWLLKPILAWLVVFVFFDGKWLPWMIPINIIFGGWTAHQRSDLCCGDLSTAVMVHKWWQGESSQNNPVLVMYSVRYVIFSPALAPCTKYLPRPMTYMELRFGDTWSIRHRDARHWKTKQKAKSHRERCQLCVSFLQPWARDKKHMFFCYGLLLAVTAARYKIKI